MKRLLSIGLIIILALCYSCKEDDETIIEVNKVEITPATLSILEGISQQLSVKILPEDAADKSITWTSSDETIATISDEGLITAIKEGECIITVNASNNKNAKCVLIVQPIIDPLVCTKVIINKGLEFTTKKALVIFKAEVLPITADQEIKWTTSDESIGYLAPKGGWVGLKAGTCTITATSTNGVTGTCKLTYDYIPVTSIDLAKETKIKLNTETELVWSVLPENANIKTLRENGVEIIGNKKGLVFKIEGQKVFLTGTIEGEYEVRLTALDKNIEGTTKVIVGCGKPEVTAISFSNENIINGELKLNIGDKCNLVYTCIPENAIVTLEDVTQTSSDETVAIWEGLVINAKKAGTTNMSISLIRGNASTSVKVIVKNKSNPSTCIDPDGRVYKTVIIAGRTWMAENFAYLPKVNNTNTGSKTEPCYYVADYNGEDVAAAKATDEYIEKGVLYNQAAAASHAPEGWHLPTNEDYMDLERSLGLTEEQLIDTSYKGRGSVAYKIKSIEGWDPAGTNESGFNIINSKYFSAPYKAGKAGKFYSKWSNKCYLWTATEVSDLDSYFYIRAIEDDDSHTIIYKSVVASTGITVRYIKNK